MEPMPPNIGSVHPDIARQYANIHGPYGTFANIGGASAPPAIPTPGVAGSNQS